MKNRERVIEGTIKIKASLEDVWEAWTTEEGIKSFFAPACDINILPGGKYEIYFNPDAPEGMKGGEGLKVMAIQPMKMFSFTWNAPPHLSEVRWHQTHVIIRFSEENSCVKVTLCHDGWGTGDEWDEAYDYFTRAWKQIVLPRLEYRFENGPINWENPPKPENLNIRTNFNIREINSSDKESVVNFVKRNWGSHLCVSKGQMHDTSVLPGFICYEEKEIIGLITYNIVNNECEIITLDSLDTHKGLGSELILKVIEKAREKSCMRVWLITTNDNVKALKFYQKRGFELVGFYRNAIDISRKLKPEIPETGTEKIPIKHEIEFEILL